MLKTERRNLQNGHVAQEVSAIHIRYGLKKKKRQQQQKKALYVIYIDEGTQEDNQRRNVSLRRVSSTSFHVHVRIFFLFSLSLCRAALSAFNFALFIFSLFFHFCLTRFHYNMLRLMSLADWCRTKKNGFCVQLWAEWSRCVCLGAYGRASDGDVVVSNAS